MIHIFSEVNNKEIENARKRYNAQMMEAQNTSIDIPLNPCLV
jgi:hypothetical protein